MHYLFKIPSPEESEAIIGQLTTLGFTHIYEIESEDEIHIGAYHTDEIVVEGLELLSMEEAPSIDWEEEWERHAPGFEGGVQTIELKPGKALKLIPGAGFGDLSHPTTHMCLEQLKEKVAGKIVIDLGSGSGILSLAARILGAREVWGIEIDSEAIEHSIENQHLNNLDHIHFSTQLPSLLPNPMEPIYILNMTLGEQEELFRAEPQLLEAKGTWIISGLLEYQKQAHLNLVGISPDHLIQEDSEDGWICLIYKKR